MRGTGKAWNPAVQEWSEATLKRFAYEWNRYFRGDLPIRNDTDVTAEDIRRCNLILFGDPSSNAVMAKGEIVITASRYVAQVVRKQHKVDPARIRIIPRGVDPMVFDPDTVVPDRIARMAQVMRVPDGMLTVVMPGRLTPWKGQAVLLRAIARLPRRDVCCVLVGSDQGRTRYSRELEKLSESLGIGDRVRIVGHVEDVPAALMLSDVVVHASTRPEAFGRVVIEALAMGRPVIATDLGGPSETVEHGVTGWLTIPGDPGTLAQALEDALGLDAEARMALGHRARASVLEHYTVRAMQDATLDVYEAVLSGRALASG